MKSFSSYDRFFNRQMLFLLISSISCFQLLHAHGAFPCKISYKITPTDHISFLIVYILPCSAQGLIQRGEPTLTDSLGFVDALFAKPKSAILTVLSLRRMFAGLRSRCRKPFSAMQMNPIKISLIMGSASSSESFSRFLRRFSRSPSLQNSVMMQQLLVVLQMSWHLRMLEWLSFLRASIQPSSMRFSGLPWMARISITFIATFSLVLSFMPRQTIELNPRPMMSLSPQEQSQIFLRRSLLPYCGFSIQI